MSIEYDPERPTVTMYPGDLAVVSYVAEDVSAFTAVAANLIGPDGVDQTAAYCGTPAASYTGNKLTSGTIGVGTGTIVAGDFKFYLTGTYDGGRKRTWYWPVSVRDKLGGV